MSDSSNFSRVIVISDPGSTQQQIITALNSEDSFELIDVLVSTDSLSREIRPAKPDIVIVDHQLSGQSTIDIIDELALQFPEIAIVAVLPENDPVATQQVMLAGARAFIVQPFTQVNLLSTLRRVSELEARRVQSQIGPTADYGSELERPVRSFSVYNPRGGVGSSTIAANLAIALHEETGAKVLLLEGKMYFGHLDVMLNIRTKNTIADLVPHVNTLDDGLVQDVVMDHISGIQVLLGPGDVQVAQGIRPDDVYTLFVNLQRMYDYIVIDSGSSLNENTVTLMDSTDRIILVANPELAALHDTSRFVQISRSLGYSPEKLLIVLNRAGIQGGVKTKDIESALHHDVFANIPDDGPNALRSLNRGIPLVMRYPRSQASKAIKMLAKNLTEQSTIEVDDVVADTVARDAQREALLASSRMG
jgi:pilus assembly protein CpaE